MHSSELVIKQSVLNELHRVKKCEIVPIINVPYDQALQKLASCDIFVGRILPSVGWIGKMDLEAMALGKAVIAYVSDEPYRQIQASCLSDHRKNIESRSGIAYRRY